MLGELFFWTFSLKIFLYLSFILLLYLIKDFLIYGYLNIPCLQTPLENLEPVLREDIQKVQICGAYASLFF